MDIKKEHEKKPLNNKTLRFLVPVLVYYGKSLIYYINNLNRVAFGIKHKNIDKYDENRILILFHIRYKTKLLQEFLNWIKSKSFYLNDYPFGNINTSVFHMVVIKFPEKFDNAYNRFLKGEYSKMYSPQELVNYFKNNPNKRILEKVKGAEFLIVDEINKEFGKNTISISDILNNLDNWEFSLPPFDKNESF